jgi:hypothetical protein
LIIFGQILFLKEIVKYRYDGDREEIVERG